MTDLDALAAVLAGAYASRTPVPPLTETCRGAQLAAGHVILTGSITAAIPVAAGDAVTASFDHLGSVTAVFD